ncbi:uncharacterized protein DNG_06949 [Cephalotrichum gorgonifer]|uniref:Uncharacterized protein n=1 Tax=Cephalotrichum gorgonifer TaxID=2041049 RepID=A0AAE8N0L7_9PEZI|nr:uncharacterized protein DNG_06949 [Cephalotrichum gorgonifer]
MDGPVFLGAILGAEIEAVDNCQDTSLNKSTPVRRVHNGPYLPPFKTKSPIPHPVLPRCAIINSSSVYPNLFEFHPPLAPLFTYETFCVTNGHCLSGLRLWQPEMMHTEPQRANTLPPTRPTRPKFNSMLTSDRLRESYLFRAPQSDPLRKPRRSVFRETGLDDAASDVSDASSVAQTPVAAMAPAASPGAEKTDLA